MLLLNTQSSPRGSDVKHKMHLLVLPVPLSIFETGISHIRDKNIPKFCGHREFHYNGWLTFPL